jgi:DNA primase
LEQVAPYLTRLEKPMEKALYLQRLSEKMRIESRLLSNYLRFPERMAAHAAHEGETAGETQVALPQRELKLVQLIALFPAFIQQAHERNVIELFTHDVLRWVFQEMVYHFLTVERIDFEKIIEGIPDEALKTIIAQELFKNDFNESNVAKSFEDLVHRLDQARKKNERLAIQSIIQSERKGYDLETLERWQQVAFDEITSKHH